jgi:hypothetical protein
VTNEPSVEQFVAQARGIDKCASCCFDLNVAMGEPRQNGRYSSEVSTVPTFLSLQVRQQSLRTGAVRRRFVGGDGA